jgi:hypothetical protein
MEHIMKAPFFITCLAIAGVAGVALALSKGDGVPTESVSEGLYEDYFRAEDLVRVSHLIVIAEFISAREERVEIRHPETGAVSVREDVLRSYRVIETILGPEQSAEIVVKSARRHETPDLRVPLNSYHGNKVRSTSCSCSGTSLKALHSGGRQPILAMQSSMAVR